MQNFNTTPTQPRVVTATFAHADGTTDTGFTAPITWSLDNSALASLDTNWGPGVTPNQVRVTPILPAAANGGTVTVSANFTNENGAVESSLFTVTIVVNPNPATQLLFS